ncbi:MULTISPECIES: MerR family transcriptional regulator [unclassified Sphingomonas]|uniref:MerR family transcriptional regulator n=1 Tax=unclassified Sphingomonas TaxID=196159 RepID=UPI000AD3D8ED|nr:MULTISPECIES: MerR family DNA-binding transcriptional regulator [unclassified Sphingomonas]
MAKRDLGLGGERQPLRGIQDVADELGVTTRAIRFYEDKGLLEPQRVGTMRVYSRREVARLQLILRGKRLGFSLREIKEFLDLYDVDSLHLAQTRQLLARVGERLDALELQRIALDQTIGELQDIARQCQDRIAAAS